MTQQNMIFRSQQSGRAIVPRWMNLVPGLPDTVELQIDLKLDGQPREQAMLLIEYWKAPGDFTLQALLPVRAFNDEAQGWCVLLPKQGVFMVRAIDPQPSPPQLSSYALDLASPEVQGPAMRLEVEFPATPPANTPIARS